MGHQDGYTITYFNHDIVWDALNIQWTYALVGWVYETDSLEEAKSQIKKNWRASAYFYKHCC
jgi:hypothetical protein